VIAPGQHAPTERCVTRASPYERSSGIPHWTVHLTIDALQVIAGVHTRPA
jgi:hypothetical protein